MPAMLCQSVGCSPLGALVLGSTGSARGKAWQRVPAPLQGWRYPGLGAGLGTIPVPEWREVDEESCWGMQAHPLLLLSTPRCGPTVPRRTGQSRADPLNSPGGLKWEITPWGGGCTHRAGQGRTIGRTIPAVPYLPSAAPGGWDRGLGGAGGCPHCVPTAPRPSDTAPALAQPGRGGWKQPPPGNDPACLLTHTRLVPKANQKSPRGKGKVPGFAASGWPDTRRWQPPEGYPGCAWAWEAPAASRGPASGDQNVTLPQECPAQCRDRGGRLPSCHRLIAYKVPYKHIVSRISCFRCRGGLYNAPPACRPALSLALSPVHA